MVGTRRTEHRATGGRPRVFRGRSTHDLVPGRLGKKKKKIGAKTLYEVKCLTLYEGRFSGDSSGDFSGDFSGNFSGNSAEFSAVGNSRNRTADGY